MSSQKRRPHVRTSTRVQTAAGLQAAARLQLALAAAHQVAAPAQLLLAGNHHLTPQSLAAANPVASQAAALPICSS